MVNLPEEAPGNGTWSIRGEQPSTLASSSSPCTATVHEEKLPLSVGASAERETLWLVDRLTYRDCFHQHMLKGEPHAVEAILPVYVMVIWTTCSSVAMAMKEEFRPKLTMMSLTSCSLPHSEETPKGFCCSSLKLSVMISFLNTPGEDTILFALISILSLLTISFTKGHIAGINWFNTYCPRMRISSVPLFPTN